jgi:putative hydrolase of the HAD superfamily
MTIRAVFFDMGGTIETYGFNRALRLEATPAVQQCLLQAGIDLRLDHEQLLDVISTGLDRYKRHSIRTLDELPPSRVWNEFIFHGYELDRGKLAEIAEELSFIIETRYYQRAMRPEIPEVLKAIKEMGLKIGLISNVNSRGQVPTNLKEYGIIHYFNPIVLSSEFGRRKPDPAIFHFAARLANVPASACLYVGDRIVRDIDGARRAGYGKAVHITHEFDHGENDEGHTPDAIIDNMIELLDILRADQACHPSRAEARKIHALIFDAGDILYHRPERGAKFVAFLKELGLEISPNHQREKKAIEYKAYRGEIDHDEYRSAIVRLYDIQDSQQIERGKQALIDDDSNVTFFEGVPETLRALKEQGYLLAIITDTANSISAKLSWFERGGFGHVWDAIISSMDMGVRKPDPKLYHAALSQLGISPDQAIFIGHHTAELEGARAVGLQTIAFNYDHDARADIYIENFADLLQVVAQDRDTTFKGSSQEHA